MLPPPTFRRRDRLIDWYERCLARTVYARLYRLGYMHRHRYLLIYGERGTRRSLAYDLGQRDGERLTLGISPLAGPPPPLPSPYDYHALRRHPNGNWYLLRQPNGTPCRPGEQISTRPGDPASWTDSDGQPVIARPVPPWTCDHYDHLFRARRGERIELRLVAPDSPTDPQPPSSEPENPGRSVLVVGNPADGFEITGPVHSDDDDMLRYAEDHGADWWLLPLTPLPDAPNHDSRG